MLSGPLISTTCLPMRSFHALGRPNPKASTLLRKKGSMCMQNVLQMLNNNKTFSIVQYILNNKKNSKLRPMHTGSLMNKEIFSLTALCFRYDKLLRLLIITDARMVQIFYVRPIQRVRIQEVTEGVLKHEHETRANF